MGKVLFKSCALIACLLTVNSSYAGLIYTYDDNSKTAIVSGNDGDVSADTQIPDGLGVNGIDYDVVGISESAFQNCESLISVRIPSSVTTIGEKAFAGCSRLRKVTLNHVYNVAAPTVTSNSFDGVSAKLIVKSEYVKSSVSNTWGGGSFDICDYGTDDISWHYSEGVLNLYGTSDMRDYDVFDDLPWSCYNLSVKSIIINEGVTGIGDYAFRNFSNLESVVFPASLKSIGSGAFRGCSSLTYLEIPSNVEFLGRGSFYGCENLTDIVIADESCLSIGEWAFQGCSKLQNIDFPNNPINLSRGAFGNCTGLLSINFPCGKIGQDAFYDCSGLKSVIIGDGVKKIEMQAFADCTTLSSVKISESVESIGKHAFSGCSSLETVTIPSSVTSIESSAFSGCSGLVSITLPSCLTHIENYILSGCSSLKSVVIPQSVTSIGDYSFYGCCSLTSINIPDNVASIGESAFKGAENITMITLGEKLETIGAGAFTGCSHLADVTCNAEKVPAADDAFTASDIANAILYVSPSLLEAYKSTTPWSGFKQIVGMTSNVIGDANGDGMVVQEDIEIVSECIMTGVEPDGFVFGNADVNGDSKINAADIVEIVNIMKVAAQQ